MWLIVTIVVFLIARQIAIKINSPLANPLLISIAVLIPLLTYLNVPFETYYADNEGISFLLQPAVVALAYPCTSNFLKSKPTGESSRLLVRSVVLCQWQPQPSSPLHLKLTSV